MLSWVLNHILVYIELVVKPFFINKFEIQLKKKTFEKPSFCGIENLNIHILLLQNTNRTVDFETSKFLKV